MPSGKRARQQRQQATAAAAPPPVRSKGVGGARARQASPRALAIAGGVLLVVVIAVVLGVVLSSGSSTPKASDFPAVGSATWAHALPGSTNVRQVFKGIRQSGLTLGSPNAPATLTEFIDLQCPVCREFETTQMPGIIQKYVRSGQLNIHMQPWEILDRPGGPGDSARGQAATIAASFQDRAFQFAQNLYNNQGVEDTGWLTPTMVHTIASSVDGMDPQRILNELGSANVKKTVRQVDSIASARNFTGTPTILLNHKGQKPHVVAVGVPNSATLQSQIEAAIRG